MRALVAALAAAAGASAALPSKGPLKAVREVYTVPAMDKTNQKITVWHPEAAGKYPLISYAHGAGGGGTFLLGYNALFEEMASFGFVVVAPQSCFLGCSKLSGWKHFFLEQLKAADWARNMSREGTYDWARSLDFSGGIGIAGHSMGGQAVGYAAVEPYISQYNIKAAMMHHPEATQVKPADFAVPIAVFTGTTDHTCSPESAQRLYDKITFKPRTFRNQVNMSHLEPVLGGITQENPYLGYFTAAWFKVYLSGDRGDFYDHIYGSGPESLCKYAPMGACENVQ